MQCRKCGAEIADKALICYKCGTATTEAKYQPAEPQKSSSRAGLVATVIAVTVFKGRGKALMFRLRTPISWACKISYLAYIAVFAWLRMPQAIFAFSVWILNDQVEKASAELVSRGLTH